MGYTSWPSFEELPLDKNGPPGNAWGLFGEGDQLGMLNLITPKSVTAAALEIREGIRISLDWPLNKPSHPTFERQKFAHKILHKSPVIMNDDVVHFNTQGSSQWDGFRHYAYQGSKQFFNGKSQEDFKTDEELSIDVWATKGGIVGRGILLDWKKWADRRGISLDPFRTGAVEVEHLKQIVAEANITIKPADILFIRVGFTSSYDRLSTGEQQQFPNRSPGGLLGLEATRKSLRWLWENQFAAIASDSPSFERGPANGPYNEPDVSIHQWALAGWGMPLGEMFDLEELSRECHRLQRYTFFLSSVPLKIPGGVASPPNAVAIL